MIVGANQIGRIARYYGLMTNGYLRRVTLGQGTTLLNVVKLVELAFYRAMDDRIGDIDSNIYTFSNEVEDLPAVVSGMFEQYDQFYREFDRMRLEQDSPQIFSTAPTAPNDLFGLFDTPDAVPSASHNLRNDMDEK
uniref:Uncharacterized protein n=1 Tax=Tanacetum cinerariifolium TaxID=118510 RepID=A0A6L2LCV2_TANCI|nr:hypothetical protein [Tanacetum cinerariifolium]